jgi:hypothetical protein
VGDAAEEKFQISKSKCQMNPKFQISKGQAKSPASHSADWIFGFGPYLEFGFWTLTFGSSFSVAKGLEK